MDLRGVVGGGRPVSGDTPPVRGDGSRATTRGRPGNGERKGARGWWEREAKGLGGPAP